MPGAGKSRKHPAVHAFYNGESGGEARQVAEGREAKAGPPFVEPYRKIAE